MNKKGERTTRILFFAFVFAAFCYRFYGILNNHPFWVDEFSSANQARLILQYGSSIFQSADVVFDAYHVAPHILMAAFYSLFGQSEFISRLPFVIMGSCIPALVFLLGTRMFNKATGVAAGILTTTSYFAIVWSRQARGYVMIQFMLLSSLYLYFEITENKKRSPLQIVLFTLFLALGMLTHSLFYIYICVLAAHFSFMHRSKMKSLMRKPIFYISLAAVIGAAYFSNFLPSVISQYGGGLLKANNIWYYHSFLWRQYGLISFLFLVGLFLAFFRNKSFFLFSFLYISLHMIFINFLFAPYVSRYLLPLWPFILLFAAYSLFTIAQIFAEKTRVSATVITLAITIAIVFNGHMFVLKPKPFYSVNHDFREIALIDYHQIYTIIKEKGNLPEGKTAVIDTWQDRLYWYLGRDFPSAYLFRWIEEEGTVNGLAKRTVFTINNSGEKIIPRQKNLRFIGEASDLEKAMNKYPKGFIFIDDSSMPEDVREYAEKNFKKELYVDHYPLDDNPYSIWPATLYSWGIEK